MDKKEWDRLCASIEEAGKIQRGEQEASRTFKFNNDPAFLAKHGDMDGECISVRSSREFSKLYGREVRLVQKRRKSLLRRVWIWLSQYFMKSFRRS